MSISSPRSWPRRPRSRHPFPPPGPETTQKPEYPQKSYEAKFAANAPVLDGKLDDAAWAAAPWTDDFVDIQGPKLPAPRYRTRAKMLWDAEYFYIAAELEELPLPYRFEVQALTHIQHQPLLEHIKRVGIVIYPAP